MTVNRSAVLLLVQKALCSTLTLISPTRCDSHARCPRSMSTKSRMILQRLKRKNWAIKEKKEQRKCRRRITGQSLFITNKKRRKSPIPSNSSFNAFLPRRQSKKNKRSSRFAGVLRTWWDCTHSAMVLPIAKSFKHLLNQSLSSIRASLSALLTARNTSLDHTI